jgi:flavin-dependent dehydrogenase
LQLLRFRFKERGAGFEAMNDTVFDAVVVGAGLGGAVAALSLAQRGARVALIEAARLPRHKVCGEFLSPEIRRTFHRVGAERELAAQDPANVGCARVVSSATHNLEMPLPAGAWGLSRFRLDQTLWSAAQRAGVETVQARVRAIEKQNDSFVVSSSDGEWHARFVLAAPGRNARFLANEYSNEGQQRYLGFKTHFAGVKPLETLSSYTLSLVVIVVSAWSKKVWSTSACWRATKR